MGDIVDASIIILTKNAGANFKPLLERILSQKFGGTFEVLVIDSGSTDGSLEIAKQFPVRMTQIEPEEFHHGRTRNLGAELSSGNILIYITQDALPLNSDWLQKLADHFEQPSVGMVIGRQIPWQTAKPPEKFFYIYNFPAHKVVLTSGASDYYRDNIFISNVNSALRKDIWEQFKFSEEIIMAEDKEFAKRILLAGWDIVYEPEAPVYHAHDFTLRAVFKRYLDYGSALAQGTKDLPKSQKAVIIKVFEYFSAEFRYLRANGYLKWMTYAVLYDGSKLLGLQFGKFKGKVRPKTGTVRRGEKGHR